VGTSVEKGRGHLVYRVEEMGMLVIAPPSANTLAKIVGGVSDNLLTSVARAWDTTGNARMRERRGLLLRR